MTVLDTARTTGTRTDRAARRPRAAAWHRRAATSLPLLREVAIVVTVLTIYDAGRVLAAQRVSGAYTSAQRLWDLERRLHLPSEQGLQHLVLRVPDVVRAANVYYASVHFPLTMAVLLWLFLRRPVAYLTMRRAIVWATAAGLVLQLAIPTAPPRMLGSVGFVDTAARYGPSVYGPVGQDKLANQFAAMPSLHVGWALLVAVVLIGACQSRWRWLWIAHPVVTLFVVVVTGNHYWLDGLVGSALVLIALALARRLPGARPVERTPALTETVRRAQPARRLQPAVIPRRRRGSAQRPCPARPAARPTTRTGR